MKNPEDLELLIEEARDAAKQGDVSSVYDICGKVHDSYPRHIRTVMNVLADLVIQAAQAQEYNTLKNAYNAAKSANLFEMYLILDSMSEKVQERYSYKVKSIERQGFKHARVYENLHRALEEAQKARSQGFLHIEDLILKKTAGIVLHGKGYFPFPQTPKDL